MENFSYKVFSSTSIFEPDFQDTSRIKFSHPECATFHKFFEGEDPLCSLLLVQGPPALGKSLFMSLQPDNEHNFKPEYFEQPKQDSKQTKEVFKPVLASGIEVSTHGRCAQKIIIIDGIDLFSFLKYSKEKDKFTARLSIASVLLSSHLCIYLKEFEDSTFDQEFADLNRLIDDLYSCIPSAGRPKLIIFLETSQEEAEKYTDFSTESFAKQFTSLQTTQLLNALKNFKQITVFPVVLQQTNDEIPTLQAKTKVRLLDKIAEFPKNELTKGSRPLHAFEFLELVNQVIDLANSSANVARLAGQPAPKNNFLKPSNIFEMQLCGMRVEIEALAKTMVKPVKEIFTVDLSTLDLEEALDYADQIDTFEAISELDLLKENLKKKIGSVVSNFMSEFDDEITNAANQQTEGVARIMMKQKPTASPLDYRLIDEIFEAEVKDLIPLIDKRKREMYLEAQSVRIRVLRKHAQVCDMSFHYECSYHILHYQNPVRKWIEYQGKCFAYFFNHEVNGYYHFNFGEIPKKS